MKAEIPVAETKPLIPSPGGRRLEGVPGFVGSSPAALRVDEPAERVEQAVQVGRDVQAEDVDVVTDVSDDGQLPRLEDRVEPSRDARATAPAREQDDLHAGTASSARVRGLDAILEPRELNVIGNVGDDVDILGLHVSPDLDSLLYALGGLIDTERGWGRADETWNALESAASWGGDDWFRLGDRDLGLHLVRTEALRSATLSEVTDALTLRAGVSARILPATDDRLRTYVTTPAGRFAFQEWFVGRRHADEVDGVDYEGAENALAAPGVVQSIVAADVILFAPSNPYLSIGPILAVREIREALERRQARCIAVSPLVGGAAVTGPAARMLTRMAGGAEPRRVAACYNGLIDALVIDESDAPAEAEVDLVVTQTLMRDANAEKRLAEIVLEAACA